MLHDCKNTTIQYDVALKSKHHTKTQNDNVQNKNKDSLKDYYLKILYEIDLKKIQEQINLLLQHYN